RLGSHPPAAAKGLLGLLLARARGEVGADAERGEHHSGTGRDPDLAPVPHLQRLHHHPANELVDHCFSFLIRWANRLCIVKSSMNPGLACWEKSPPLSPKDASERS